MCDKIISNFKTYIYKTYRSTAIQIGPCVISNGSWWTIIIRPGWIPSLAKTFLYKISLLLIYSSNNLFLWYIPITNIVETEKKTICRNGSRRRKGIILEALDFEISAMRQAQSSQGKVQVRMQFFPPTNHFFFQKTFLYQYMM